MDLKNKPQNIKWIFGIIFVAIFLAGCVPKGEDTDKLADSSTESFASTTKIPERTIVTSVSIARIMEKLDIELVGIIESNSFELPSRYKDIKKVGLAMNPDIEIIRSLNPDIVLSPLSLVEDLKPKYEQANLNYGFVNLNSVQGMFRAIDEIGELYGAQDKARELLDEYESYMQNYSKQNLGKIRPRVLILMGLPGSYVVATDKSYVGSLVELSGAINVYQDDEKPFLNINIEDMLKKKPDIILRTAHALPDDVKKMFAKEFAENENWRHFDAVKESKVYDLDYKKFGMSANFEYQEALEDLQEILWNR